MLIIKLHVIGLFQLQSAEATQNLTFSMEDLIYDIKT